MSAASRRILANAERKKQAAGQNQVIKDGELAAANETSDAVDPTSRGGQQNISTHKNTFAQAARDKRPVSPLITGMPQINKKSQQLAKRNEGQNIEDRLIEEQRK